MNLNLTANEPPHVKSTDNTRKVMLTVITALLPAVITGTYFFGLRALLLIAVCVSTCVASEFLIQRLRGVETTTGDL
ncbi:MAG: RnfABCDGE type electron transport complex subunit D, partial [Candidatus Omnitrophica bacterium]|nr:RnfABCDGE type electron transport complex subunit D [Candidatus Omnitrophota bacterium]